MTYRAVGFVDGKQVTAYGITPRHAKANLVRQFPSAVHIYTEVSHVRGTSQS